MSELDLDYGEYAVAQLSDVAFSDATGETRADIILTNKNLYIDAGTLFRRRGRNVTKYSISQIPVIDGQARISIEGRMGTAQIEILLKSGAVLQIAEGRKADFLDFASHINKLLTGVATVPTKRTRTAADGIADVFQGGLAAFGSRISSKGAGGGGGLSRGAASEVPQETSTRCEGCGAPLSGYEGQLITCSYCDTEQRL